jgi:TolA-binding protein
MPTFISIFLLILFYSTNKIKSFNSNELSIESNQSDKVETISEDSVNYDDMDMRLEQLRNNRKSLEDNVEKLRTNKLKELEEIENSLEENRSQNHKKSIKKSNRPKQQI